VAAVHEVVEVRNDVVDRAPVVAERNAAVHAARALDLRLVVLQREDELLVVLDARLHRGVVLLQALVFHEAGDFSHVRFLLITWPKRPWSSCPTPSPSRWCRRLPW